METKIYTKDDHFFGTTDKNVSDAEKICKVLGTCVVNVIGTNTKVLVTVEEAVDGKFFRLDV